MKAILIDSVNRKVTEVEVEPSLQSYYKILSYEDRLKVDCIDCWNIDENCAVYIDDEGLLKDVQDFFIVGKKALAGQGLVVSHDNFGETIDVQVTVEQVEAMVKFAELDTIRVLAHLNHIY